MAPPREAWKRRPPTFVDDVVLLAVHAAVDAMVYQLVDTARIVMRVGRFRGLMANFASGKRQAVAALHGLRVLCACERLTTLEESTGALGDAIALLSLGDGQGLRVAQSYRHLGVMIHAGSHMGMELASRRPTWRPLPFRGAA